MSKEANSTLTLHDVVTVVEHQSTHFKVGVGSSSQAPAKVYATTAEAIANFKPTHREVISGIAPHVFDERKRRRSRRRASSPSRTYWCEPGGEKRPSPLRGTTVVAWEEHSFYLDQPDLQHLSKENHIKISSTDAFKSSAANVQLQETTHNNNTSGTVLEKIDSNNLKTEAFWKYLRIDTHLFKLKTIAVKLKSSRTR